MARREINLDEETDRILEEFAREYVEQCEEAHRETLLAQLERGTRGFREGRATSWDEVKRRNNL
jgi:hypothetical protein